MSMSAGSGATLKKTTIWDRIVFLFTAHMAGAKVVSGMDQHSLYATGFHTLAFGVLVLLCIMLLLFGFDLLTNRFLPVVTTLIPLSLSLGLMYDHLPGMALPYLLLVVAIYLVSILVRFIGSDRTVTLTTAGVHGVAGILVTVLPIVLWLIGQASLQKLWVSFGGLVIGGGGLMLTLQKLGYHRWNSERIYRWFPMVLLLATVAFYLGLRS